MSKIKIHFYRGTRFFSYLIRWRTFSEFSHVSIQIDDKIYEAKEGKGVVATVAKKELPRSLVDTIEYEVSDETLVKCEKWLKTQIGNKYDYTSILFFVGLPRGYKKDHSWFCSELGAWFLHLAGVIEKPKKLYSPGALYLLLK